MEPSSESESTNVIGGHNTPLIFESSPTMERQLQGKPHAIRLSDEGIDYTDYELVLRRILNGGKHQQPCRERQIFRSNEESSKIDTHLMLQGLEKVLNDPSNDFTCPHWSWKSGSYKNCVYKKTYSYKGLVHHMLTVHQSHFGFKPQSEPLDINHGRDKFSCASCHFTTSHQVQFFEHVRHHANSETPYRCNRCRVQLNAHSVSEHMKTCPVLSKEEDVFELHNDLSIAALMLQLRYVCSVCVTSPAKGRFLDKASYIAHLNEHCGFAPVKKNDDLRRASLPYKKQGSVFECSSCQFKTFILDAFIEHLRCHLVTTPYKCKKCERDFKSPQEFNVHCTGCGRSTMEVDERFYRQLEKTLKQVFSDAIKAEQNKTQTFVRPDVEVRIRKPNTASETRTADSQGKEDKNSAGYVCEKHAYSTNIYTLFLRHVAKKHIDFTKVNREVPDNACPITYKDNQYICQGCSFASSVRIAFQEHMRIHTVPMPYHCMQCKQDVLSLMESHDNKCSQLHLVVKESTDMEMIMSKLGPQAPAISHEVIDRKANEELVIIEKPETNMSSVYNDPDEGFVITEDTLCPKHSGLELVEPAEQVKSREPQYPPKVIESTESVIDLTSDNATRKPPETSRAGKTIVKVINTELSMDTLRKPSFGKFKDSPGDEVHIFTPARDLVATHSSKNGAAVKQVGKKFGANKASLPVKRKGMSILKGKLPLSPLRKKSQAISLKAKRHVSYQDKKVKIHITPQAKPLAPVSIKIVGERNEKANSEALECIFSFLQLSSKASKETVQITSKKEELDYGFLLKRFEERLLDSGLTQFVCPMSEIEIETACQKMYTYKGLLWHLLYKHECKFGVGGGMKIGTPKITHDDEHYVCVTCGYETPYPVFIFEHIRHHIMGSQIYYFVTRAGTISFSAWNIMTVLNECFREAFFESTTAIKFSLNISHETLQFLLRHRFICAPCKIGLLPLPSYLQHLSQHARSSISVDAVKMFLGSGSDVPSLYTETPVVFAKRAKKLKRDLAKVDNSYICRTCDFSSTCLDTWQEHLRSHLTMRPYKCTCCSLGFRDLQSFLYHLKAMPASRNTDIIINHDCAANIRYLMESVEETTCSSALVSALSGKPPEGQVKQSVNYTHSAATDAFQAGSSRIPSTLEVAAEAQETFIANEPDINYETGAVDSKGLHPSESEMVVLAANLKDRLVSDNKETKMTPAPKQSGDIMLLEVFSNKSGEVTKAAVENCDDSSQAVEICDVSTQRVESSDVTKHFTESDDVTIRSATVSADDASSDTCSAMGEEQQCAIDSDCDELPLIINEETSKDTNDMATTISIDQQSNGRERSEGQVSAIPEHIVIETPTPTKEKLKQMNSPKYRYEVNPDMTIKVEHAEAMLRSFLFEDEFDHFKFRQLMIGPGDFAAIKNALYSVYNEERPPQPCSMCLNCNYTTLRELVGHVLDAHPEEAEKFQGKELFRFKTLRIPHSVKGFKCWLCPTETHHAIVMLEHLRHHSDRKPYACCGQIFDASTFTIHRREKCTVGGKSFTSSVNRRLCDKVQPYLFVVPGTNKVFNNLRTFLRSLAVTEGPIYFCNTDKVFYLDMIKVVDKKYTCTCCQLDFYRMDGVMEHIRAHFTKTSYNCLTCNVCVNGRLDHGSERCVYEIVRKEKIEAILSFMYGYLTGTEDIDSGIPTTCSSSEKPSLVFEFKADSYLQLVSSLIGSRKTSLISKTGGYPTKIVVRCNNTSKMMYYQCTKCNLYIENIVLLKEHLRSHLRPRSFVCVSCNLNVVKRCLVCNYRFASSAILRPNQMLNRFMTAFLQCEESVSGDKHRFRCYDFWDIVEKGPVIGDDSGGSDEKQNSDQTVETGVQSEAEDLGAKTAWDAVAEQIVAAALNTNVGSSETHSSDVISTPVSGMGDKSSTIFATCTQIITKDTAIVPPPQAPVPVSMISLVNNTVTITPAENQIITIPHDNEDNPDAQNSSASDITQDDVAQNASDSDMIHDTVVKQKTHQVIDVEKERSTASTHVIAPQCRATKPVKIGAPPSTNKLISIEPIQKSYTNSTNDIVLKTRVAPSIEPSPNTVIVLDSTQPLGTENDLRALFSEDTHVPEKPPSLAKGDAGKSNLPIVIGSDDAPTTAIATQKIAPKIPTSVASVSVVRDDTSVQMPQNEVLVPITLTTVNGLLCMIMPDNSPALTNILISQNTAPIHTSGSTTQSNPPNIGSTVRHNNQNQDQNTGTTAQKQSRPHVYIHSSAVQPLRKKFITSITSGGQEKRPVIRPRQAQAPKKVMQSPPSKIVPQGFVTKMDNVTSPQRQIYQIGRTVTLGTGDVGNPRVLNFKLPSQGETVSKPVKRTFQESETGQVDSYYLYVCTVADRIEVSFRSTKDADEEVVGYKGYKLDCNKRGQYVCKTCNFKNKLKSRFEFHVFTDLHRSFNGKCSNLNPRKRLIKYRDCKAVAFIMDKLDAFFLLKFVGQGSTSSAKLISSSEQKALGDSRLENGTITQVETPHVVIGTASSVVEIDSNTRPSTSQSEHSAVDLTQESTSVSEIGQSSAPTQQKEDILVDLTDEASALAQRWMTHDHPYALSPELIKVSYVHCTFGVHSELEVIRKKNSVQPDVIDVGSGQDKPGQSGNKELAAAQKDIPRNTCDAVAPVVDKAQVVKLFYVFANENGYFCMQCDYWVNNLSVFKGHMFRHLHPLGYCNFSPIKDNKWNYSCKRHQLLIKILNDQIMGHGAYKPIEICVGQDTPPEDGDPSTAPAVIHGPLAKKINQPLRKTWDPASQSKKKKSIPVMSSLPRAYETGDHRQAEDVLALYTPYHRDTVPMEIGVVYSEMIDEAVSSLAPYPTWAMQDQLAPDIAGSDLGENVDESVKGNASQMLPKDAIIVGEIPKAMKQFLQKMRIQKKHKKAKRVLEANSLKKWFDSMLIKAKGGITVRHEETSLRPEPVVLVDSDSESSVSSEDNVRKDGPRPALSPKAKKKSLKKDSNKSQRKEKHKKSPRNLRSNNLAEETRALDPPQTSSKKISPHKIIGMLRSESPLSAEYVPKLPGPISTIEDITQQWVNDHADPVDSEIDKWDANADLVIGQDDLDTGVESEQGDVIDETGSEQVEPTVTSLNFNDRVNVNKTITCNKCDFVAWSKAQLESHAQWHEEESTHLKSMPDARFFCPYCPCVTSALGDFKFHLQFHKASKNKLKYFQCASCSWNTNKENVIEAHHRENHQNATSVFCDDEDTSYLVKTFKTSYHKERYRCPKESCTVGMNHVIALQEHCVRQHGHPLDDKHRLDFYPESVQDLDIQDLDDSSHTNLNKSKEAADQSLPDLLGDDFECDFCSYEAADVEDLKSHLFNMHGVSREVMQRLMGDSAGTPQQAPKTNEETEKVVPEDQTSPPTQTDIQSHAQEKAKVIDRYECTRCTFWTREQASMHLHIMVHLHYYPYSCPMCNFSALRSSNVTAHIGSAHGDKKDATFVVKTNAKMEAKLKESIRIVFQSGVYDSDKSPSKVNSPEKSTIDVDMPKENDVSPNNVRRGIENNDMSECINLDTSVESCALGKSTDAADTLSDFGLTSNSNMITDQAHHKAHSASTKEQNKSSDSLMFVDEETPQIEDQVKLAYSSNVSEHGDDIYDTYLGENSDAEDLNEPVLSSSKRCPDSYKSQTDSTLHTSPKSPVLHATPTGPALHTSPKDPTLHTSLKDSALHTSPKDPALHTSLKDPALHTGLKDPALHTSLKDPALQTGLKDPALHTSLKDPALQTSPEEPALHTGPKSPTLHTTPTDQVLHTSLNEPQSPTSSKDAVLLTSLKDKALYRNLHDSSFMQDLPLLTSSDRGDSFDTDDTQTTITSPPRKMSVRLNFSAKKKETSRKIEDKVNMTFTASKRVVDGRISDNEPSNKVTRLDDDINSSKTAELGEIEQLAKDSRNSASKENTSTEQNKRDTSMVQKFKCRYCHFKNKSRNLVKSHLSTAHFNPRYYRCPKCGKRFEKRNPVLTHIEQCDPNSTVKFRICEDKAILMKIERSIIPIMVERDQPTSCTNKSKDKELDFVITSEIDAQNKERAAHEKNKFKNNHTKVSETSGQEIKESCEREKEKAKDMGTVGNLCDVMIDNILIKTRSSVDSEKEKNTTQKVESAKKGSGSSKKSTTARKESESKIVDIKSMSEVKAVSIPCIPALSRIPATYDCMYCRFQTNYKESMKAHLYHHNDFKPYKCNLCDYQSCIVKNCRRHLKRVHLTGWNEYSFVEDSKMKEKIRRDLKKCTVSTVTSQSKVQLNCDECEFCVDYEKKSLLRVHLMEHLDYRPFYCSLCSFKATTTNDMKAHLKVKHGNKGKLVLHTNEKLKRKVRFRSRAILRKTKTRQNALLEKGNAQITDSSANETREEISANQAQDHPSGAQDVNSSRNSSLNFKAARPLVKNLAEVKVVLEDVMKVARKKLGSRIKPEIAGDNAVSEFENDLNISDDSESVSRKRSALSEDDCNAERKSARICIVETPQEVIENSKPCQINQDTEELLKKNEGKIIREADEPSTWVHECGQCEFKASKRLILRRHVRAHFKPKPFGCSDCNFKCARKTEIDEHLLNTHPDTEAIIQTLYDSKLETQIENCMRKVFVSERTLSSIKKREIVQRDNRIENRLKEFSDTVKVAKPQKDEKGKINSKASDKVGNDKAFYEKRKLKGTLKCKKCGFESTNNGHDRITCHVRSHFNYKPFKCSGCPYKSEYRGNVVKHLGTKHKQGNVRMRCELNPKLDKLVKSNIINVFSRKPGEINHTIGREKVEGKNKRKRETKVNIESQLDSNVIGERKVKQADTGKDATESNSLANDSASSLIGSKLRRVYECKKCSHRTNGDKCRILRHVRSHFDYRPFKCNGCSYTCTHRRYIIAHLATVHKHKRVSFHTALDKKMEKKIESSWEAVIMHADSVDTESSFTERSESELSSVSTKCNDKNKRISYSSLRKSATSKSKSPSNFNQTTKEGVKNNTSTTDTGKITRKIQKMKDVPDKGIEKNNDSLNANEKLYEERKVEIVSPEMVETFKCVLCNLNKSSRCKMKEHLMHEMGYHRYGCPVCDVRRFYPGKIIDHCRVYHPDVHALPVPLTCPKKEKELTRLLEQSTYRTAPDLDITPRPVHDEDYVKETVTGSRLEPEVVKESQESYFEDTEFERTPIQIPRADPFTGVRQCAFCRYKSSDTDNMKSHVVLHAPPHWRCDHCDVAFILLKRLLKHGMSAHKTMHSYTNLVTGEKCINGKIQERRNSKSSPAKKSLQKKTKSGPKSSKKSSPYNVTENRKVSQKSTSKAIKGNKLRNKSGTKTKGKSSWTDHPLVENAETKIPYDSDVCDDEASQDEVILSADYSFDSDDSLDISDEIFVINSSMESENSMTIENVVKGSFYPRVMLKNFMDLPIADLHLLLCCHGVRNINYK